MQEIISDKSRVALALRAVVYLGLPALVLLMLYLVRVAWGLAVDYYDGYQVLHNARVFASPEQMDQYFHQRGLLPSFVLAGLMSLFHGLQNVDVLFRVSHLLSVAYLAGLAAILFVFFRLRFPKRESLLGTCLIIFNPLIIHQAPFCKEDILGTLLLTAAYTLYIRDWGRLSWNSALTAGVLAGLAMITRYNLVPIFFIVVLNDYYLRGGKRWWRLILGYLILPGLIFVLLPTVVLTFKSLAPLVESGHQYLNNLAMIVGTQSVAFQNPIQNITFLVKSMTPPLFLLGIWGIVDCVRHKRSEFLMFGIWIFFYLLFHSTVVGLKESRYLFICFPAIYVFVLMGYKGLLQLSFWTRFKQKDLLRVLLSALLLLWPAKLAIDECVKFQDPFYYTPYEKRVSEFAAQVAGSHVIHWAGYFYSLLPEQHVFDKDDEYTYVYDYFHHVMGYYTDQESIADYFSLGIVPPDDLWSEYSVAGIARWTDDGDALIINPEISQGPLRSRDNRLALIVARSHKTRYVLESDEQLEIFNYVSTDGSGTLTLRQNMEGSRLLGKGLLDGRYDVYIPFLNEETYTVDVVAGQFAISLPALDVNVVDNDIWLARLTISGRFPPP